jgi:hypothetical protein
MKPLGLYPTTVGEDVTDEDTPFITADVLANDVDPSGSPLWVESFDSSGTLGEVSLAGLAGSLDTTGFNGMVM